MRVTKKHPGSGTSFAEDSRRDGASALAATNLERGWGAKCVVGDHLGGELCIDCINRMAGNSAKTSFDPVDRNTTLIAVRNLREGVGVGSAAGNHSGGNTCPQVIAAVDDTY